MLDPRTETRLWLVISQSDKGVDLKVTRMEPSPSAQGVAMLRVRGKSASEDQVLHLAGVSALPAGGLTATAYDATLVDAATVLVVLGGRRKRIACAGVKTTDLLIARPVAEPPAGYVIGDVVCTENGWVRVGFVGPALAIGAGNTIPLKITALR